MKTWIINDRSGKRLYVGTAETKKSFIQSLIDSGKSLAGADLRGQNLSHLQLDGADFTGADLSGSELRGCTANRARFDGAILDGIRAEGLTARQATFRHARIGVFETRGRRQHAAFDGAVLTYCRFDASQCDQTSFEGCSMTGANCSMGKFVKCTFRNAILINVDWTRSQTLRCDLRDTQLHTDTAAARIPRASLPNRTADAVAVGNNLAGAVTDDTVSAFKRDKFFGGLDTHLAWTASTAAMLLAATYLPVDTTGDWLTPLVGQGVVLVGALTLINILKEKLTEKVQEHISEFTLQAQLAVRSAVIDLHQRGTNMVETIAALAVGPGIKAISKALSATADDARRSGLGATVANLAVGGTDVVLCDKRHMAMALEWISTSFDRTELMNRDMVISRAKGDSDEVPTIMKFFAGGGMSAFWTKDGHVVRTMGWSADELTVDVAEGMPGDLPTAVEVRRMFERAIINDYLPGTKAEYDPAKQHIRAGLDGSLVITQNSTQLPSNRRGPVLIRTDGRSYNESAARHLLKLENPEGPSEPRFA